MWKSSLAKNNQNNQNSRGRTQLQKGGVVYSHMIDRDLTAAEDLIQAWESLNLTVDQKLYRLIFAYNVLSALLLRTKQRKKDVIKLL